MKHNIKGGNRIIVEVDRIRQGEKRKELYVDARDLQKDENTTDAEYKEILKERGIEKLNEYNKVEIADFSIDTLANLKYKTDFDLGDKAVYKNDELGFNVENRIIGISEVYENGNMTLDVSFGIKKVTEVI